MSADPLPRTLDAIHTIPEQVLAAKLQQETVLLHLGTRTYHRLNDSASAIWAALERGLPRGSIVQALGDEFDVEPAVAEAEVDRLLDALHARDLVRLD